MKNTNIKFRNYQEACLQKCNTFFQSSQRGLISIPTGGGKTIIFNKFSLDNSSKTLVISHRHELISQAIEKAILIEPSVEVGFIRQGNYDIDATIISAGIQTLHKSIGTENFNLLAKKLNLIVIDEAHHTMARTYLETLNTILEINPDVKILGVTATPFRTDNQNLKEFYKELIYSIDIQELIREGFLVPIRAKIIHLGVNIDDVKIVRKANGEKDFSTKDLSIMFNTDEINNAVFESWLHESNGKKTIFFLPAVENSKALFEIFKENNIASAHIDGTMPLARREQIIDDFHEGKIKALFNVDILLEGFDDASVECIANLRPTKSLSLFTQLVGRGLRLSPDTGKKECLLLDYAGVSKKHKIANLFKLFGIEVDAKTQRNTKEIAIGATIDSEGNRNLSILFGDKASSEEFDFFGKESIDFITKIGKLRVISCGLNGKFVVVEENEHGTYNLKIISSSKESISIIESKENLPQDYALSAAIEFWEEHKDGYIQKFLSDKQNVPPTQTQLDYIKALIDKEIIHATDINVKKLNRFDAMNILSYGFYVAKNKNIMFKTKLRVPTVLFIDTYRQYLSGQLINNQSLPKWCYVLLSTIAAHERKNDEIIIKKEKETQSVFVGKFKFDYQEYIENNFIHDGVQYVLQYNKYLAKRIAGKF